MKEKDRHVRIPNEPENDAERAFGELLRIQNDFHTRLAEEALKYLHRLQGTAMPTAPGTVMMPGEASELRASGRAGESVELRLEVENRQRVHCSLTPVLTPLVGAAGVTWFPAAEPSPVITLLAPGQVVPLVIKLPLPSHLPVGTYNGALLLQGFREGALAVAVVVTGDGTKEATTAGALAAGSNTGSAKSRSSKKASSKKASKKKATKGRRSTSKRT